jgi:hypothetical protein
MFILMTAWQNDLDATTNSINMVELDNALERLVDQDDSLAPVECQGVYKGQVEPSRQVFCSLEDAISLADKYNQESILVVENHVGRLVYLDGQPDQALGQWRSCSESEAKAQDSYTYDVKHNIYYVCG